MKRLRLVKLIVQPVVMCDDGNTLTELPTQVVEVPVVDLDNFADKLRMDLADAEAQLNGPPLDD